MESLCYFVKNADEEEKEDDSKEGIKEEKQNFLNTNGASEIILIDFAIILLQDGNFEV